METNRTAPSPFPVVRRGYDPSAVQQFVDDLEARLRDAQRPDEAAREQGRAVVERARAEAAAILEDARRVNGEADRRHNEARQVVDSAHEERDRLLDEADGSAQQILTAAGERATEIISGAEAIESEARSARWSDVADRVARILAVADDEAVGLVEDATEESATLRSDAVAEAQRVRDEADVYAAEAKALAEEWAAARMAAAEADQTKAAEVLMAARARAHRIRTDAEHEAAVSHDAATRRTTEHVQELLSEARYDLEQLEQRATEARSYLQGVRELAARTLDGEVVRPLTHLAPSARALLDAPSTGSSDHRGDDDIDLSDLDDDVHHAPVTTLEQRSSSGS